MVDRVVLILGLLNNILCPVVHCGKSAYLLLINLPFEGDIFYINPISDHALRDMLSSQDSFLPG